MNRKLGGFPIWVWGGVIVGGLLLGLYLRRRAQSQATVAPGQAGSYSTLPSLSDLANAAGGGGVSPDVAAGLDPNLLALLADSNSQLVQSQQTLAGLTDSSVHGALDLAGRVTDNAFSFATYNNQQVFGLASDVIHSYLTTPPVYVVPSSSGSGSSTPAPPPVSSAPSVSSGPFGEPSLQLSSPVVQAALAAHRAPPGGF